MQPISLASSGKVANLSVFISLFVAAHHLPWSPEGSWETTFCLATKYSLFLVTVPFFMLLSGFFLAGHFSEDGWFLREFKKRLRSLLVPYVVWITLHLLVVLALTGALLGPGAYGLNPCKPPVLVALWYVRCLLVFVAVSPFVKWALARWGKGFLVVLYGLNFICALLFGSGVMSEQGGVGGFLSYTFAVEGFFYFSLGAYLQSHRYEFKSSWVPALLLLTGVAIVALRIALHLAGVLLPIAPTVFFVPFLLIGIWHFAPTCRLPAWLRGGAFSIFLMHGTVYAVFAHFVGLGCSWQKWTALICAIVLPCLAYNVVCRLPPIVGKLLFGGR